MHPQDQQPAPQSEEELQIINKVNESIQSEDIPTQCGKCHAINGHMRDCPDFSQPISPENSKEEITEGEVVNPDTAIEKQGENRDAAGKFVPGVSGNPHGRPKREWTWASLIEDFADRKVKTKDGGEYTYREAVIKRLYTEAANGNMLAVKEIMNRMDGMPSQPIGNAPGKNGQVEAFIVRNTNYANAIDEEVAPALAEGTKDGGDTGDTNTA
jgi:hypothetical protein